MNEEHHTTASAGAASLSDSSCPVIGLARLAAAFRTDWLSQDRRGRESRRALRVSEAGYYDEARENAHDGEDAVCDLISSTRAVSIEGAAVQIGLVINRLDEIFDFIPDEFGHRRDLLHRRMARLLFSALSVVEQHSSESVAQLMWEGFPSSYLDPWVNVDERLADPAEDRS
ncbi:hypothetical protein [Aureimonas sp. ME7]|uniref:hypothetical protein n=1 Tax=Aureimonas sp. ME7 TaxID=2744252 RepID=UPI0015F7FA88|nr:hypothetical protein [Aureimonas sp. ME7]